MVVDIVITHPPCSATVLPGTSQQTLDCKNAISINETFQVRMELARTHQNTRQRHTITSPSESGELLL
jgi:hypothetical protein